MGHTLVTRFDFIGYKKICSLVEDAEGKHQKLLKIPYGRNCNRVEADKNLPYHMTVFHWGKEQDSIYLVRMHEFQFSPCSLTVTGVSCMYAEEGSLLLYLDVITDREYGQMRTHLEKILQNHTTVFPHITLAVSKDHEAILKLKSCVEKKDVFPIQLNIIALDIYHIWNPVKRVATFGIT